MEDPIDTESLTESPERRSETREPARDDYNADLTCKPLEGGAYMGQHLSLTSSGKAVRVKKSHGQNRTREIRPSGIVGRLEET
jgi:hypothetical protein